MRKCIVFLSCISFVLFSGSLQAEQQSTPSFSIEEAIHKALSESPKIREAQAGFQAQKERKRGAWSGLGPRVQASFQEVHFDEPITVKFNNDIITVRSDQSRTGSLRVLQPVTGILPLIANIRLQGEALDLSEMKLEKTRQELAFEAAETWIEAFKTEKHVGVTKSSKLAVEKQLQDAHAMQRVGRLNRGDVLKLELLFSETKTRDVQAKAMRALAHAKLKELVGFPLKPEISLGSVIPEPLETKLSPEEALKQALETRLERKQAQSGVGIASFAKKIAYSKFSPSVNLFFQWDRNMGDLDTFGQGKRDVKSYGVQATWDLWNNGESVFEVRESSQRILEAEQAITQVEKMIRMEVVAALAQLRASQESFAFARIAVEQAEESYRIEKVKFSSGKSSASDLILAESAATRAKAGYVAAESELLSWHLKLQKALGQKRPQFKST